MPDAHEAFSAREGAGRPPTPIVFVGHVDHGKSTLIGRLLHDTGSLPEGRVEAARASSERRGLGLEWSFLLDSLQAERDQGVTIDVARLPFAIGSRPFVIIDAPGHRQFLRNMVTGAADAAASVLVVDVSEGVQEQTRRHAVMLRLVGVEHVIVLMNKADLLGFDEARVRAAAAGLSDYLEGQGIHAVAMIPASARHGDNIAERSARTGWYTGPTLIEAIDAVPPVASRAEQPFRMPVQDVYRQGDRRVVVGRVESGRVAIGDSVAIGAGAVEARVAAIEAWASPPVHEAVAGQSTALVLEPEIVVERGEMLADPAFRLSRSSRVRARLFWLRPEALAIGEQLRLRIATAEVPVTVAAIERVVPIDDPGAAEETAATSVPPEGFADIVLAAAQEIVFDPFRPGGGGGRGVLADAYGRIVGGAPLVEAVPISPAQSIHPVSSAVTPGERTARRGHEGGVFWMTGLPGAGKSTLACAAERLLFDRGVDVVVLDGDTLRSRLNKDLGFSDEDRTENVRRTAAVARLMADQGLVVLVALISPLRAQRALARDLGGTFFHEIFVDAAATVCEQRDPKGHYAAARAGRLPGFTGIDDGYEKPDVPALRIDTTAGPPATCAETLASFVQARIARDGGGALRAGDAAAMADRSSRE